MITRDLGRSGPSGCRRLRPAQPGSPTWRPIWGRLTAGLPMKTEACSMIWPTRFWGTDTPPERWRGSTGESVGPGDNKTV